MNLNAEAGGGVAVKAEPDMHSQPQDLDIRATVLLLYPTALGSPVRAGKRSPKRGDG